MPTSSSMRRWWSWLLNLLLMKVYCCSHGKRVHLLLLRRLCPRSFHQCRRSAVSALRITQRADAVQGSCVETTCISSGVATHVTRDAEGIPVDAVAPNRCTCAPPRPYRYGGTNEQPAASGPRREAMLITEAAARQGVRGIDARVPSASRDGAGRGMTSFQGDVVRKARTVRMKATLEAYFPIVDRDSSTYIPYAVSLTNAG